MTQEQLQQLINQQRAQLDLMERLMRYTERGLSDLKDDLDEVANTLEAQGFNVTRLIASNETRLLQIKKTESYER